jgi:predicted permease
MFAAVINAAFPVFALILTGWLCTKAGFLGVTTREGLNRFVIYLALPAQLFSTMSTTPLADLAEPGFFAAFGLGIFGTAAIYALIARSKGESGLDNIINGMSSAYSNVGFMGIPLCLMVFGKGGLGPSIITTLFTVSVLFAATIMVADLHRFSHATPLTAIKNVARSMLRNPLLLAPALGLGWSYFQLEMPLAIGRYVELISDAATPCALIAIGLFLGETSGWGRNPIVIRIALLKLLVQPALTAFFVLYVFDMPRLWQLVAILASALPVGTGPFMMAQIYERDAHASAQAILISTVLSVFTISLLIAWISQQLPT